MSESITRSGWVQHGKVPVQNVMAQLPHLWEEAMPEEATPDPDLHLAAALQTNIHALEEAAKARIAAIEAHAAERIAEAEAEATRWRDHALATEAESNARGFAAGYADGMQQGRTEGEAAMKAEMKAMVAQVAGVAKKARIETRKSIQEAQTALGTLSIEIARAVVGEALHIDHGLLARRIAAMLDKVGDSTTTIVRVHPMDLVGLQPLWPAATRARRTGERGPRMVGDATLTPGDCIVEGHIRYFDGRLEPLFTLVAEAFTALPAPVQRDDAHYEQDGMVA